MTDPTMTAEIEPPAEPLPPLVIETACRASVSIALDILHVADILPRLPDGTYANPLLAREWAERIRGHFLADWQFQLLMARDIQPETVETR